MFWVFKPNLCGLYYLVIIQASLKVMSIFTLGAGILQAHSSKPCRAQSTSSVIWPPYSKWGDLPVPSWGLHGWTPNICYSQLVSIFSFHNVVYLFHDKGTFIFFLLTFPLTSFIKKSLKNLAVGKEQHSVSRK